jgi:MYXO-CTERM domain-containing protein
MKFRLMILALLGASYSGMAEAHISLTYPPDRLVTNGVGDPQKSSDGTPCPTRGTRSNKREILKAGSEITVQWNETIHHSGHFRIAFDDDGSDAFVDPKSFTDIVATPTLPILADGLFADHRQRQAFSTKVRLPNVVCKTCTLQVIQVMTDKPPYGNGDDIYYHCADIELVMDTGGSPDGGARDGGVRDGRSPDRSPGTGGAGGSAGAGGSGGVGGGTAGTGGAPTAGSGGGSAGRGGSSGSGGSGGSPPSEPAGGFCSIGGGDQKPAFALLFAAVAIGLLRRRRRS